MLERWRCRLEWADALDLPAACAHPNQLISVNVHSTENVITTAIIGVSNGYVIQRKRCQPLTLKFYGRLAPIPPMYSLANP